MAAINNAIAKDEEKGAAIRLFIGVLNINTGVLDFCNANHDAPLMVSNELHHLPVEQNIAVGEQRNWEYEPQEIQILPGTMIFLNTEGLIKVKNKEHRIFNEKRMLGSALQAMKLDPRPKPFIENMLDAVNRFAGDYEQRDDIALLAIRFKGARKLLQNGAEIEPEIDEEPEVKPQQASKPQPKPSMQPEMPEEPKVIVEPEVIIEPEVILDPEEYEEPQIIEDADIVENADVIEDAEIVE